MSRGSTALLLLALCALASLSAAQKPLLVVDFHDSLATVVKTRLMVLINQGMASSYNISTGTFAPEQLPGGSTILSFGPTATTRRIISAEDVKSTGPEGYVIAGLDVNFSGLPGRSILVLAADGNHPDRSVSDVFPPGVAVPNTGLNYGCYAMLERYNYNFLHPLQPHIPDQVQLRPEIPPPFSFSGFKVKKSAKWPIRGWHYHTEHPLELTNFLNGWGLTSPDDEVGWKSMLPEWGLYLEWLVANRQNAIEFLLLAADDWSSFVSSPIRQGRFKQITDLALQWGVAVAADVPIATRQQHAWYMTDALGTFADQVKQIQERIDWLMAAGFHFLSTESGFSEFTHPACTTMVAWMNATTQYTRSKYGRRTVIKAHISTGQMCPEYADPTTGVPPCNFNYLPHYADIDLGVLPHTVQMYSFDDPAPTYGQTNFSNMFKYAVVEAATKRYTLYHGETAYWVNYDIDLPLFLPYYAQARMHDLRKLERAEMTQGVRFMGQMNFESGWEWSYWLQNSITARAAYSLPLPDLSERHAMNNALVEITNLFGPVQYRLVGWLLDYMEMQRELLVFGNVTGTPPPDVTRRNGIAFLEGWDTWAQLMPVVGMGTQPLNLDLASMQVDSGQEWYATAVRPLLQAMVTRFQAAMGKLDPLFAECPASAKAYFADIYDSAEVTLKRAQFVLAVYDSVWTAKSEDWRREQFVAAVSFLKDASVIIARRESMYRVPLSRIAAWGRNINPTSYDFGYVWTVHSRFYWFRDLYRAADKIRAINPCFLNIIDPARIASGDPFLSEFEAYLRAFLQKIGVGFATECFEAPASEPVYSYPTL